MGYAPPPPLLPPVKKNKEIFEHSFIICQGNIRKFFRDFKADKENERKKDEKGFSAQSNSKMELFKS